MLSGIVVPAPAICAPGRGILLHFPYGEVIFFAGTVVWILPRPANAEVQGRRQVVQQEEDPMAFKPSYRQLRSERTRAKQRKRDEKLQRREEEAAKRKVARDPEQLPDEGAKTG